MTINTDSNVRRTVKARGVSCPDWGYPVYPRADPREPSTLKFKFSDAIGASGRARPSAAHGILTPNERRVRAVGSGASQW